MDKLWDDISEAFTGFDWENAVEIGIIAIAIFWLLRLLRGTTAMTVVRGISFVAVTVVVLSRVLDSIVLDWIVNNALAVLVLFVLIVFQPEFRRALARVGRTGGVRSWLGLGRDTYHPLIDVVAEAALHLADRRAGALIVVERKTGLQDVVETGVPVDAVPSAQLLEGIFYPHSPLHDGAVVIRPGRVVAASCMLPPSTEFLPSSVGYDAADGHLGTRHRAAVGISEQTDAVVVVVSEETGVISLATDGRLIRRLDQRRLESLLGSLLNGDRRGARQRRPTVESG